MFGPLPRLYRITLITVALVICIGAGAWVARLPDVPFLPPVGALLGAVAGLAVAWALVHDFHHGESRPTRTLRRR